MSEKMRRFRSVAFWVVTAFVALGIGSAGLSKLLTTGEWDRLFQSWGYPMWFMFTIGCIEILGAAAMLVPRFALAGALLLAAVMLGAAGTLIRHPGTHFFRGRQAPMRATTPLVWFAVLSAIAFVRWRQMRMSARASS